MTPRPGPLPSNGAGPVRADDVQPIGPLPPSGPPAALVALGFAILAVGLFFLLEGRRHQATPALSSPGESSSAALEPSAPTLEVPPPPPPPAPAAPAPVTPPPAPPPPRIEYVERPGPPPPPIIRYVDRPGPAQPPPAALGRLSEPALVVDLVEAPKEGAQQGDDAAARATILRNRASLVPQGTLIPAVLETPIDSTRPGPVRALTSSDTRGFDGTRVLIPRGSRLVGEYKAEVQAGQKRVLVTWNRLVRPDGVAIKLTSPASDTVGGTGIAGDVNNHLLARVSGVVLQTALTIGVNLASNPGNGSIVIGSPAQSVAGAGQTLVPQSDLKPTITVREGAAITVFVTRDLDFGGALPRP